MLQYWHKHHDRKLKFDSLIYSNCLKLLLVYFKKIETQVYRLKGKFPFFQGDFCGVINQNFVVCGQPKHNLLILPLMTYKTVLTCNIYTHIKEFNLNWKSNSINFSKSVIHLQNRFWHPYFIRYFFSFYLLWGILNFNPLLNWQSSWL